MASEGRECCGAHGESRADLKSVTGSVLGDLHVGVNSPASRAQHALPRSQSLMTTSELFHAVFDIRILQEETRTKDRREKSWEYSLLRSDETGQSQQQSFGITFLASHHDCSGTGHPRPVHECARQRPRSVRDRKSRIAHAEVE